MVRVCGRKVRPVGISRLHLPAEPGQGIHAGCGHRRLLEVGRASSKDGGGLSLCGNPQAPRTPRPWTLTIIGKSMSCLYFHRPPRDSDDSTEPSDSITYGRKLLGVS